MDNDIVIDSLLNNYFTHCHFQLLVALSVILHYCTSLSLEKVYRVRNIVLFTVICIFRRFTYLSLA